MIPYSITRDYVLGAIDGIRKGGVPDHRKSTKYCLVFQGRHFPPKYVISLAYSKLTGHELPAEQFNGGAETNDFLYDLGFETVHCNCGGIKHLTPHQPKSIDSHESVRTQPSTQLSVPSRNPKAMVEYFYQLLYTLPRRNHLTKPAQLPENGIYFFFERGETVTVRGNTLDRVVRVGSHTGQGNFRSRIKQHYGNSGSLSGNKNGSVFRMHLGAALMARDNPSDPRLPAWCKHMGASYPEIEETVSRTLRASFTFVCFRVDDAGERLDLEKGLIALIAQYPLGKPSPGWLGRHSHKEEIRASGLWNVQHLDAPPLTERQFYRLEFYIRTS